MTFEMACVSERETDMRERETEREGWSNCVIGVFIERVEGRCLESHHSD